MFCYLGPYENVGSGKLQLPTPPAGSRGIAISGKNPPPGDLGVFWSERELKGTDHLPLGDGDPRECRPSEAARQDWARIAGHDPQGDTVVDWIWSQHTTGSDPSAENGTGTLVPTTQRNLELVLDGIGVVRRERFRMGEHSHSNRLRDCLRISLNDVRQECFARKRIDPKTGKVDPESHRKFAKAIIEKYRVTWAAIKPAEWDDDEQPFAHDTNISDAFTDSDGTNLTSHTAGGITWSESSDTAKIYSDRLRRGTATNLWTAQRAQSDLSTNDSYARIRVKTFTAGVNNHLMGPTTRGNSSNYAAYMAFAQWYTTPNYYYLYTQSTTGQFGSFIAQNTSITIAVDDVLQVVANGSTISALLNGSTILSATNTAISSGTRSGSHLYWDSNGAPVLECDDFAAGDYPEAIPASPIINNRHRNTLLRM